MPREPFVSAEKKWRDYSGTLVLTSPAPQILSVTPRCDLCFTRAIQPTSRDELSSLMKSNSSQGSSRRKIRFAGQGYCSSPHVRKLSQPQWSAVFRCSPTACSFEWTNCNTWKSTSEARRSAQKPARLLVNWCKCWQTTIWFCHVNGRDCSSSDSAFSEYKSHLGANWRRAQHWIAWLILRWLVLLIQFVRRWRHQIRRARRFFAVRGHHRWRRKHQTVLSVRLSPPLVFSACQARVAPRALMDRIRI